MEPFLYGGFSMFSLQLRRAALLLTQEKCSYRRNDRIA